MMQQQQAKRKNKKKGRASTKYPGIAKHAAALGINRTSLYRYLEGSWPFPAETRRRYEALTNGVES
jgi:hypothetical protein